MTDQSEILHVGIDDERFGKLLIEVVTRWHTQKLAETRQLMQVPEGMTAMYSSAEDNIESYPIELTGDTHKAFMMGVVAVASLFVDLPFERVDPEEELEHAAASTTVQ